MTAKEVFQAEGGVHPSTSNLTLPERLLDHDNAAVKILGVAAAIGYIQVISTVELINDHILNKDK